jgi:anti-sigma regulatory factor (Ser/Thr protein kinase)
MRPQQTGPAESPQQVASHGTAGVAEPFHAALAVSTAAPAAARAGVTAWIAGHVTDAMLVDVQLVVCELVTNSLRHAEVPPDAVICVRAEVVDDVLRLEVVDCGTSGAIALRAPDLLGSGGFGLNLVDVVSRRWGVTRNGDTRVWAELAFAPAG